MAELPDFDKAQYVGDSGARAELAPGQDLVGASWSEPIAEGIVSKAILLGAVAAVLGSIAYGAFTLITHIEIGFIALFLGAFIAGTMMHATRGIGGRQYQIAAAVLTYLSYCGACIVEVLWELNKRGTDVGHISVRGYLRLSGMALMSPFTALENFVSGAIGLFILFLAMRSAWSGTAGKRVNA